MPCPCCAAHGGAILHLSSGVATTGTRNRAAYTASKGAILSLTRNMALDYAADKVRVNCLCPGFVNTPLLASMPPERRAKLAALHPLGRMGEPEDIAPMALFLISDQASWITGQAIAVDGGFNIGHATISDFVPTIPTQLGQDSFPDGRGTFRPPSTDPRL